MGGEYSPHPPVDETLIVCHVELEDKLLFRQYKWCREAREVHVVVFHTYMSSDISYMPCNNKTGLAITNLASYKM